MKPIVSVLLSSLFLFSCNNLTIDDKYEIATSADGSAYRMEKSTGKVWLISGNTMEEIQLKHLRLSIGHRYKGADGYSFTYSGKGKFTDIKSFDEEMEKYRDKYNY